MSYLTREIFLKKVEESGSKYWREGKNYRWQYMSYVIDRLKEICPDDTKLIEAGTSGMPLSDKSYLYEYPKRDLNVIPYLRHSDRIIHDKTFDAFVALQVWEHLDNQSAAFQEVMRISHAAILSFPYQWNYGDSRHKNITWQKISKWTCGVKPISKKIIKERIICVWKF